jgi:fluoride exporter
MIIALGGALGALARYALGVFVGNRMGVRFPYGTFLINMTGSFAIGLVMTILSERTHLNRNWLYLIPIGFIGAYTTFSTFELESLRLVQDGQLVSAIINLFGSVLVGFAMVILGAMTGRVLP